MTSLIIDRPVYQMEYPRTSELLDKLYELDCAAYGRHAVDRSILEKWVHQCPESITLLLHEGEIAGAFGLLAVSQEQARRFIAGDLSESEFDSLPEGVRDHPYWYWSGIVVRPEYRKTKKSPARSLLMRGIDSWLSSDRVGDCPHVYVYALGCSQDGLGLLNRFQFEKIREAEEMRDDAPLFVREAPCLETARTQLKEMFC